MKMLVSASALTIIIDNSQKLISTFKFKLIINGICYNVGENSIKLLEFIRRTANNE